MNTKYSDKHHSSLKALCDEFYTARHVTLERFDSNKMQNRQVTINQFRIELLKTHDRYMTHANEARDMSMTNMNEYSGDISQRYTIMAEFDKKMGEFHTNYESMKQEIHNR